MFSPETGQELHLIKEVILRHKRWDCSCSACTQFLSQHPIDYVGLEALPLDDFAAKAAEVNGIAERARFRSRLALHLDKKARAVEPIGVLLAQGSRTATQLTAEIAGLGREAIDSALKTLLDNGLIAAEDGRFVLSAAAGVQDAIARLHDDLAAEAESVAQQAITLSAERDQLREEVDDFRRTKIDPLAPLAGRSSQIRRQARATRIEHNQIVINRLIWQARKLMDDLPLLLAWVEDRVRRYQAATTRPYARHIEACLQLVKSIKLGI
jgi:hypothetical protein